MRGLKFLVWNRLFIFINEWGSYILLIYLYVHAQGYNAFYSIIPVVIACNIYSYKRLRDVEQKYLWNTHQFRNDISPLTYIIWRKFFTDVDIWMSCVLVIYLYYHTNIYYMAYVVIILVVTFNIYAFKSLRDVENKFIWKIVTK